MELKATQYGVCIPGFRASGIRRGKYGVALIVSDTICDAAAVFTKNSVSAAPVKYTKAMVGRGVQAVVANSGNANCCVPQGFDDAFETAQYASKELGVALKNVAVASTGIIGRRMDVAQVKELIGEAATSLSPSPKGS